MLGGAIHDVFAFNIALKNNIDTIVDFSALDDIIQLEIIMYIPRAMGYVYLVAIMDWASHTAKKTFSRQPVKGNRTH